MTTNPVPFHQRRLERSATDKWLGGVLGGIAQTYEWNPTLVRVLFIVSLVLPGPQVLIYLAVWIVMAMNGR